MENRVCLILWAVPVYLYEFCTEKRARHISAFDRHLAVDGPMSVRFGVSALYCDIFKETGNRYEISEACLEAHVWRLEKIKWKEREFFSITMSYLGHFIHHRQLLVSPRTINWTRVFESPRKLGNSDRSKAYATSSHVLWLPWGRLKPWKKETAERSIDKLCKTVTKDELLALRTLVQNLITASVTSLKELQGTFRLDAGTKNGHVGHIPFQNQPMGSHEQISYRLRSLHDVEPAYDAMHSECIAMVCAVLLLKQYMEGTQLKFWTAQEVQCKILNTANVSGKLARWRFNLSEFKFNVAHRASVNHQVADAQSWLTIDEQNRTDQRDTSTHDGAG